MVNFFLDKRVLITEACGTVGSVLTDQLLKSYQALEVIGIDNNESELFFFGTEIFHVRKRPIFSCRYTHQGKLSRLMKGVDIVFHTAVLKHVVLCERSPFEAIQTNILGVKNIINAATDNNIERVIFTSSDKAVNPTNVMGTSKLMGERILTTANSNLRDSDTIFVSTRFGNVLGSRGSGNTYF